MGLVLIGLGEQPNTRDRANPWTISFLWLNDYNKPQINTCGLLTIDCGIAREWLVFRRDIIGALNVGLERISWVLLVRALDSVSG